MTGSPALAPVAVFAYRRPDHLRRTLDALAANGEAHGTELHIFCDGAKAKDDAALVAQTQAVARAAMGFAAVHVHARDTNAGLARSVIDGVTRMLQSHDRVIVVEDDLVVSPHFLSYMNHALRLYAGDERVASIHAYSYPVPQTLPDTFFLRGADCWGWGTWARAWNHFDADGAKLRDALRERGLELAFDLEGAYPYMRMLEDQIAGRVDSWAIRWHASAFLRDMLTLHPGRSLVHNIGNEGSGTHTGKTAAFGERAAQSPVRLARIPVTEDVAARKAIAAFLRSTQPRHASRWRRLLQKVRGRA